MLIKQVIGFHGIVFLLFHYPEKKMRQNRLHIQLQVKKTCTKFKLSINIDNPIVYSILTYIVSLTLINQLPLSNHSPTYNRSLPNCTWVFVHNLRVLPTIPSDSHFPLYLLAYTRLQISCIFHVIRYCKVQIWSHRTCVHDL